MAETGAWVGTRGLPGTRSSTVRETPEDNEFVFVSFRRHVNVVDHRHACVDEEDQREAGRENVARFRVLKKGENERALHGR